MLVTCWYKNGSLKAFRQFCTQNQDKTVSIKLTNRSEPVKGALCNYSLNSSKAEGLFILLTDRVFHPAYYGLEGIESMHIVHHEAFSPVSGSACSAYSAYSDDMSPSLNMASSHLAL